jgi:hypothetical protein
MMASGPSRPSGLGGPKESIYVLRLAGGYFYVGKTKDVNRRVEEHSGARPGGSAWAQAHGPIERVTIWGEARSPFDEDNVTKEYMEEHGIDRVRGGAHVEMELEPATVALLRKEEWARGGKCTRCGWGSHFFVDCIAERTVDGRTPSRAKRARPVAGFHPWPGADADVAPAHQGDEGCASPRSGRVGQPETPATCERPPTSRKRTLAAPCEEEEGEHEEGAEHCAAACAPNARIADRTADAVRRALWGVNDASEPLDAAQVRSRAGEEQLSLLSLPADAQKAAGDRRLWTGEAVAAAADGLPTTDRLCARGGATEPHPGRCFRCRCDGHYASRCARSSGASLSEADNEDDDGPYRRRARRA